MTYDEFVIESMLRLGTVPDPTGSFRHNDTAEACLTRALVLAETLVRKNILQPNYTMLRFVFEDYSNSVTHVEHIRKSYGVMRIAGSPADLPIKIRKSIGAKHKFLGIAKRLESQLSAKATELGARRGSKIDKTGDEAIDYLLDAITGDPEEPNPYDDFSEYDDDPKSRRQIDCAEREWLDELEKSEVYGSKELREDLLQVREEEESFIKKITHNPSGQVRSN
jgi:hypothetical protein